MMVATKRRADSASDAAVPAKRLKSIPLAVVQMRAFAALPPAVRANDGGASARLLRTALLHAAARVPALPNCDNLLAAMARLWRATRSAAASPESFELETLNLLLEGCGKGRGVTTWTAAVREPLLVFHCPARLFLCPALLHMLLTILRTLLDASSCTVALTAPAPPPLTAAPQAAAAAQSSQQPSSSSSSPPPPPPPPPPVKAAHPMMRVLLQEAIATHCLLAMLDGASTAGVPGARAPPPRAKQLVVEFLRELFRASPAVLGLAMHQAASAHLPWILEAAGA